MGEQTNAAKITGKYSVINTIITGICVIMSAFIGISSFDISKTNETLTTENIELVQENSVWKNAYTNLQEQFNEMSSKNISLVNELNNLKNNIEQYSTSINENALINENNLLKEENNFLKNEIVQLENEKKELENKIKELEGEGKIEPPDPPVTPKSDKKVSIFDLDTFQGNSPWEHPYNASYYTDTYGNEYVTAYSGSHNSKTKEDYYVPTYLLDNKYSMCEGQIAWSKHDKNSEHSAWIEFYSGDDLIYTTDIITATDRIISFSFSVDGLETLTIVTNSTINTFNNNVYIIYPYLNLVE